MNLVLSTDPKPRLKWTLQLHQRFIEAVNQLGGPDKATPKSLMKVMGIHGLTLSHLKSHLQKYRLGKSHRSLPNFSEVDSECSKIQLSDASNFIGWRICDAKQSLSKDVDFQIAGALEMQRKLGEQIEVQRCLQLRIEAQGKYLQAVLRKAQEALSENSCSSLGGEVAKLVKMVDAGCSTLSAGGCCGFNSMESSTTCSEDEEICGGEATAFNKAYAVQPTEKRATFDLNAMFPSDSGSGSKAIDLNAKESGQSAF